MNNSIFAENSTFSFGCSWCTMAMCFHAVSCVFTKTDRIQLELCVKCILPNFIIGLNGCYLPCPIHNPAKI